MNTDKNRELLWRTVPFVMAMLLLALTGIPASAIFGREKAAPAADAGAPIAQSIDVRVYRGIPYTGTLAAIDREGGEVSFAIAEQPSKGTVTLDGETFVYTSAKNKTGADRFTYTATDAAGSTSAPAEVRITIARAKCGVTYDDMVESAAYTAAVDLAEHGVFVGATMASETTAAATGAVGVVRRDPMAMRPFCGYNMADYWQHWLDMGEKLPNAPKIFNVNWFRTDDNGRFLWPGFGDNLRVLEWILKRCFDEVGADETPIGYEPKPEDINLDGCGVTVETLRQLLTLDAESWRENCAGIREYFEQFGDKLPHELRDELEALEKAFAE